MKGACADDLHIEWPLPEGAFRCFAHHREGLVFEIVGRFTSGEPVSELDRLGREVGVVQRLDFGFERVDPDDERLKLLQSLALSKPKRL